ncbi:MAG TPA: hypothetical protein VF625_16540 [Longimicrobium sp.]|jgi:hypothetical protein
MRRDLDSPARSTPGAPPSARRLGPYETAYDTRRGYDTPPPPSADERASVVVFRGRERGEG